MNRQALKILAVVLTAALIPSRGVTQDSTKPTGVSHAAPLAEGPFSERAAHIYFEALADSIRIAEGNNPRWLYGVHHPDQSAPLTETEARHRCLNTIRHAWRDWNRQGSFINFLAGRYCPGNRLNWSNNVSAILNRQLLCRA
jgi:hypothetical protein